MHRAMQRPCHFARLYKKQIMRKIFICCSIMLACMVTALSAAAQGTTRSVSGYNGDECNGPFNVQVKIDGTETLRLDVDADILDDIETKVDNGVLKEQMKHGWRNHRNVRRANVYITAKQLRYLGNGGSGNMELEGTVTGTDAKLELSGSGNLRAAVKAGSLQLHLSGSGGITAKGSAGNTEVSISGSGNVNARELTAQKVDASISGSGGVEIVANQTVSARISGSGGVEFSGNATIADTHYSGSGRVNKRN